MSSRPSNSTPPYGAAQAPDAARSSLVLRGADVSCRVQPWSFQPDTAQLVLYHQQRLPSLADLQRWTDRLSELGYTKVRTTALSTPAGLRAESAGFRSIQELVLLEHTAPRAAARHATLSTHRLLVSQHAEASSIDIAAFGDDWALEPTAVGDVCNATPRHRARGAGAPLAAYAITGRDAKQGFLQRLAVAPQQQRNGLGRALVLDSLQWLARWRVARVLVNTPTDNQPALALYEQLGFRRLSERLRVYELALT
ncbi:MAG: GNAT family N-acetyltransferase [Ilumatobacteraceae bacterium]